MPTTSGAPARSDEDDLISLLDRQRKLWLAGQRPSLTELLRGSSRRQDTDLQLDLLYNEIVVREELGESPTLPEYAERHPELADELALQFEVHEAVVHPCLLDTDRGTDEESWPASGKEAGTQPNLPDYEILTEMGRGGSAVVYRARHRQLHRTVALKMFQPDRLPTPRELARFRVEAEAVARLTHPNIVQVFDIGELLGRPYLALELAAGGTLAQRLQKLPLTQTDAAELIATLARAVQHAHERQVIHRDLKPANVLFTADGTPKIADFGLAKVLADVEGANRDQTRTGEPIGTPRYMSPEQATGRHDLVGPATDVYALGTLLYECLTGRAPFVEPSVVDTLRKIRDEDPIPLRRLQSSIPRDLSTICLKCLQKEPERRYATAAELAEDLGRFQRCEPIHARPTPYVERVWKRCRRRPAEAALIAVCVVTVLTLIAALLTGAQVERNRIAQLREDVAELMTAGQMAMNQDDVPFAQARFQEAWRLVQSEPALADHVPGVAGWLDHSGRAASQQHWQRRLPPREFDERRDEALIESLLLEPRSENAVQLAREAIAAALELTIANDVAWRTDRELLVLTEAELLAHSRGSAEALAHLDEYSEFASRRWNLRRAAYLTKLNRGKEAEEATSQAEEFPPDELGMRLLEGFRLIRSQNFDAALAEFEAVLAAEPAHFEARLCQAVCFLHLQRSQEAKIGLTACIAQRPDFPWSYYHRAQAWKASEDFSAAASDLQRALASKPSPTLRQSAEALQASLP